MKVQKVLGIAIVILICFSCKNEKSVLRISDGTIFEPKEYYPEFSWNTTPQYFMFGDMERLLKPEEVDFIAERTGFVCIEKSHGLKPLGAAELGAKHEAAAFKKVKSGTKVLFYFNSAWAWPFTSYNKNFRPETIDDFPELKGLLIVDTETGKPELEPRRKTYRFDVLNPEFRQWWVETVVNGVKVSGCDGAFIDQMHGFYNLRPDKKEEVLKAQGEMMAELKRGMGPDKILLANNANDDIAKYVYPHIDATMFEHYNGKLYSKENLLKEWDDMLKNAKEGKMSIFRFGVEHESETYDYMNKKEHYDEIKTLAKEKVEYFLSCYLIGAQPYAYFQYGWGWDLSDGSLMDYPELLNPLGAPLGAYKRINPEGWEFEREFEHASVWVNTESKKSKITWDLP